MTVNDILLKVPLRVEVISPIHIGTGERLSNKSCVVKNQEVYMADEQKLLALITSTPRLQTAFERFCLDRSPLSRFLRDNGLDVSQVAEYAVDSIGTSVNLNFYLPFIKSGSYPSRPYLPGSSLKGALRSAFLRAYLLTNESARKEGAQFIREAFEAGNPKAADDGLEQSFYGQDQHHEWLRLLQINDTQPVHLKQLQVAEVRIYSSAQNRQLQQKTGRGGNPVVLSPEVLASKTNLKSALVVNQYLAQGPAEKQLGFKAYLSRIADFAVACNQVAEEHISQEIQFYEYHRQQDLATWYKDLDEQRKALRPDQFECLIRLGWGTGYDNKTVSDIFDDDTFNAIRDTYDLPVGRPGRRGRPLPKRLSPKSRKLAVVRNERGGESLQPLGWLCLRAQ